MLVCRSVISWSAGSWFRIFDALGEEEICAGGRQIDRLCGVGPYNRAAHEQKREDSDLTTSMPAPITKKSRFAASRGGTPKAMRNAG